MVKIKSIYVYVKRKIVRHINALGLDEKIPRRNQMILNSS